jgi:phage regulator Rha-like protein
MTTNSDTDFVSIERIAQSILVLRKQRVLLDSDLAAMYGVPTKRFNEQVKRNLARFPADFAFQLSEDEAESLRSQFATLKKDRRGQHRKYLPYAFTEHGAIMAAMVLNSARAVEMSVYVVRAFVQLRSVLASDADLGRRITKVERGQESHEGVIVGILKTIHQMKNVPQTRAIGFIDLEEKKK